MNFLVMCFVWLVVFITFGALFSASFYFWLRERNMADRTWQDKVRHQIRRVLLY